MGELGASSRSSGILSRLRGQCDLVDDLLWIWESGYGMHIGSLIVAALASGTGLWAAYLWWAGQSNSG